MDFNNLKKDYEESQMKLKALEKELINANSKFSFSEQKLHDNFQNLSSTEKKLSQITIQKDSLQRNIDFLEKQLSQYKSTYLDYKSRSEKEINILRADLEEIQKEKEELHKLILSTKSDLNKTIFKLKLLSQENETLKSDNDHLIKILEESNQIVKTSEAKSLSIDNTINEYKKTNFRVNFRK
jgi:chromosome segregation ATPase